MCKRTLIFIAVISVLSLTWPAAARITYVDANEGEAGNTTLASGETFNSTDDGSGSDNLWRGRAFGNGATIFESGGVYDATANTEDCPRLMTTVEVPEDDYEVYAYFWSDSAQWRLAASLSNDPNLPMYVANDPNSPVSAAPTSDFTDPAPMVSEGNRTLWKVYLGTTGVTNLISVYIDDDPNHQTYEARTWYDGIGYQPVPPRIVYVDASDGETGNTTLATGETFVPVDSGSGSDGLWRIRPNFANEGTIYEAGGDWQSEGNTEDCPRLMTTVDVNENIYQVYAYFWSDGDTWRMAASLTDEPNMPLYIANDPNTLATVADINNFEAPVPMLTEGNRTLWQIYLGKTEKSSSITVYVDDDPNHLNGSARTWYDGIGYKVAPPRIVYVDANDGEAGNTSLVTGETFIPTDSGSGEDGLWRLRTGFANGSTIYESGGNWEADSNIEDCPRLMTLTEVPEGYYEVYAYFWSDTSEWRMGASLTDDEGELPLYIANDPNTEATLAASEDFAEPIPLLAEGNRALWQIYLGKTELTDLIQVYIDDDPNHLTGNSRTWYDGIGYKAEE